MMGSALGEPKSVSPSVTGVKLGVTEKASSIALTEDIYRMVKLQGVVILILK